MASGLRKKKSSLNLIFSAFEIGWHHDVYRPF
jgi:hypothetical protein